ncbi:MAG: FGGY-family carbohydrate kinase, partial [Pseudomonadota bacterium]
VNDRFSPNTEGAVHAFCHALPRTWHQMGVILSATDSLAWLAEVTGVPVADLAARVPAPPATPSDILFLPYLSGERTPHNAPGATARFEGLRRDHGLPDLVQAVMEGVAFAFADCRRVLEAAGTELSEVWLAGGGTRSDAWLGIVAAATGLTLLKPAEGENGAARGAARLARLAAGEASPEDVLRPPALARRIDPAPEAVAAYAERHAAFRAAYR